jgi:hypothetical protein
VTKIKSYIIKVLSYLFVEFVDLRKYSFMKDTVIIQLTTPKTMKLLLELEELNLLKVIKKNDLSKEKLSDKYAGKLPEDVADRLHKHMEDSRNEWDR